jgi:hypothetical protein
VKSLTIRQLSPDTFSRWMDEQKVALKAFMESEVTPNVLIAYGKATFKSGRALHLEIQSKLERNDERVRASQKVFNMPALFVQSECGGISIVNPNNIAVWQVVPGLKNSTSFAIPAELKSIQKS